MKVSEAIHLFELACVKEIRAGANNIDDVCEEYIDHRARLINVNNLADRYEYLTGIRGVLSELYEDLRDSSSSLRARLRKHYEKKDLNWHKNVNEVRSKRAKERYVNARRDARAIMIGYIAEIDEILDDNGSSSSYSSTS